MCLYGWYDIVCCGGGGHTQTILNQFFLLDSPGNGVSFHTIVFQLFRLFSLLYPLVVVMCVCMCVLAAVTQEAM